MDCKTKMKELADRLNLDLSRFCLYHFLPHLVIFWPEATPYNEH